MTRHWIAAGPWRAHTRVLGPSADESVTAPSMRGDVVLVHGLGMSGRYLLPTQRLLAEDFRVFAPDLPGFGRSPRPAHPLTLPELAEALVAWMDAVGLERAGLFGHSLGCQVAAHVADRHSDRVSCLVLVSPSRDSRARRPWQQALRLLADAPRGAPSLSPIAVSDYLRAGPWRMWRTLVESMQTDATGRLSRPCHPALVVRGERDPVVSAWWAQRVTDLLSDGELVTLPGDPHGLVFSSADALAQAARPFLAAHR